MRKPTSLVTGGAGFIGSHVVDHLLQMGHEVVVLDDLSGGFTRNVSEKAKLVTGSILDEKLLDMLFKKYRFNYVYHLAAYAAEGLSHFIRHFNYKNNLVGSINLINRSVLYKTRRFIFTSSIAVYGANQTPMREDMEPQPEDPYGIAKYAIELDLKAAHHMFGLEYTIFRPHNVYGERQNHGDPYRNVLGIFVNSIMLGKPMTIFGDGSQTRAFSYIDDVAPHIAHCIEYKKTINQIYNIGADIPYSVKDLAHTMANAMNVKPYIKYLQARKEVLHAYSDHSKVKKHFKIKKTVDLITGVERMVQWAQEIGPLKTSKFKNIEVAHNMPPSWKKLVE
ncbi:UDP-glucose 4-epimerase [Candidatus Roizmanbacteria bacterium RIFCSPHIGHO2_02_FULL_40_13b]|uniref:UDP-glucose 4-epimerase n=1 Tax=Candidatus Roizmanbacteria bacterium RIFCSPHIGHO2_01_FULL_39_24 TaxID=1802032 RepID=A0A1F7GM94_9BACT|nr:MAG: UDP-glucose 4-epimerase [Candidatus Roizmanbacteria bacterium RIFCSPHIGHO2_01_FULL_39_24]OGK27743.1 MAG: UDP-glucose 4-epimerase [Candidatus Roizmanbacteria bacterium RIFCSPHIGHO2_02_FULL_40_13b]OGK49507.1 MAG: UDP-glucose 4-epimerase [Candidatus Roizmanbacteria bacterium RIFCSPLOWO2_01_FULL_40_32]